MTEKPPDILEKERLPSETRTIRFDGDINAGLEEIAKTENVSVSLVINRAVQRHVEWEYRAEKFGFSTTSSSLLKRLFDHLTEDQARGLGKELGSQFIYEFVVAWFKTLTLDTLLQALDYLGNRYGRGFSFEHGSDGKAHTVILRHDRGARTSAYYAEALKSLFARLGLNAQAQESDQQVTITVQV